MSHQKRLWSLIATCIVSLLAINTSAAIPGADNPTAYTEHDYRKQLLEFNHRAIVDAYQQVGHHDPKWDDAAGKFLEAMTIRLANANADREYVLPNPYPSSDQLESMGQAALTAGCDDPLVIDMVCIVLNDEGKIEELQLLIRKNVNVLSQSKYSPFLAANCIRRSMRVTDPSRSHVLYEKLELMLHDAELATAKLNDWPGPIDRRIVLETISPDFQNLPLEKQAAFYDEMKSADCDAWMTNMIGGWYHINAGWDARGDGTADTVTKNGAEGLAKEMDAAKECLQAAYKLQPTYPEAATGMMTVAMGQSDSAAIRGWFDKAVQGQLDYEVAYSSYAYALLPRWFGNHDKMYAFGKECVATNRYDTRVPRMLMMMLNDIRNDDGNDWSFWRSPGVFEEARDMLAKYAQNSADPSAKGFYTSEIAGWAWQLHRFDEARKALDQIDGKIDSDGMGEADAIPDRTASCIYALTGESKDVLTKAEADNAAGNIDAAIAAYDAAAKSLKPADRDAAWIKGRDQELKWQKQFDASDWVNLITSDPDMPGWWNRKGTFSSDGQAISGIVSGNETSAVCGNRFGLRWEMQIKMQLVPASDGVKVPKLAEVGPVYCWTPTLHGGGNSFRVRPFGQEQVFHEAGAPPFYIQRVKVPKKTTLNISLWDGEGALIIDGTPWFTNRDTWQSYDPECRVGFVSNSPPPGAKFIITELKIRQPTTQPSTTQNDSAPSSDGPSNSPKRPPASPKQAPMSRNG